MNKYEVIWYSGCFLGNANDINILKSEIMKSEDIDELDFRKILPKEIRKEIKYFRMLKPSDEEVHIDYGSWSRFIRIKKIVD